MSTDSSQFQVPVHTALTSDMMLGLKPSAPKSRSYRVNITPNNKSVFVPLDTISIDIPTGRHGTWLDQSQSYLKFSVQVKTTDACPVGGDGIYFDNSAYSLIQRMDVYHQSNLLETINEYGQLANTLIDTSLTMSDKAGLSSMIGTNHINNFTTSTALYSRYSSVTALQTAGDRSGMSLAAATVIGNSIPYTFSLPLLSGVLGVNASKMLPLKDLSAPINVQFYLSSIDDAFCYGLPAVGLTYQLINVELCAQFVEITDDTFNHNPEIPQYISTTTYRQASTYLPEATSGEISNLIGIRCASLTQLIARFRNRASAVQGANATASYRKSSSINPNLSYYYWKIGSQLVPNKPVYLVNGTMASSGGEAFAELLKGFHALSSSVGNSAITSSMYNVATEATGGWALAYAPSSRASAVLPGTDANSFLIGTELQTFSNRNDTILSGVSTLNTPIYLTVSTISGKTVGTAITVDVFGQMDCILVIQDGIMSAKY